ncbi:MAG TPA: hypothetical protein VJ124_10720 [Pyrinomonadaceae bacterium]|nr:hypothetical protein [Pyrinomonadaceae bacterium]
MQSLPSKYSLVRWLSISFWIIAIVLGFFHAWADHHYIPNPDGLSYLDIANAYVRGDWQTAINAYWSPLYSWLIALAFGITRPSAYWEFSVLHLLNFAIYIFALGCFSFLIGQLRQFNRNIADYLDRAKLVNLPDWAWPALGYPLFIWSSLYVTPISMVTPDLLVGAFVFLAAGLLLQIRRRRRVFLSFVLLGVVLGFGYLSKSVMFPLSFVLLGVSLFSVGNLWKGFQRVLVAFGVFLLIAGPFIFAISRAKGRMTFGESARLTHSWTVAGISNIHSKGPLAHPPRRIFDTPPIYEFGEPISGTYPLWYDPSYWNEGLASPPNTRAQIGAVVKNLSVYYELLFTNVHYGLLIGFLTLYLVSGRRWMLLRDLARYSDLIIFALVALGAYALVSVNKRYVEAFIVLLWLMLFSGLRLSDTAASKRLMTCAISVLMAMMTLTVVGSSTQEAYLATRNLIAGEDLSTHPHWRVAEGLRQMGVERGDKVAVVGDSFGAFWAHLAGLKIVADITFADAALFWKIDAPQRDQAIEALAKTGAKAIVADRPTLSGENSGGWRRISDTDYYAYMLK